MKIHKKTWTYYGLKYDIIIIEMSGMHQFLFYSNLIGNIAIVDRKYEIENIEPYKRITTYIIQYGLQTEKYSSMTTEFVVKKIEDFIKNVAGKDIHIEYEPDSLLEDKIISFTTNI